MRRRLERSKELIPIAEKNFNDYKSTYLIDKDFEYVKNNEVRLKRLLELFNFMMRELE